MRGIRAEAVFGDNDLEVMLGVELTLGVILTELGDEALGHVAFTVIFLGAIVLDNGLGHQGNHFTLIGVDERATQHLMGIGCSTVSMLFF